MQYFKLFCFTYIAAGFAFGLPERYLNDDLISVFVGLTFAVALLPLFPHAKK